MRRLTALLCLFAMSAQAADPPPLTLATTTASKGAEAARAPAAMSSLDHAQKQGLLRQNIRYVFILFQENRAFDHYFGTYPGANGLFSSFTGADAADPTQQAANKGASYRQILWNTDGSFATITPFLIPRSVQNSGGKTVQLYPEDVASVDHSREGMSAAEHSDIATRRT